MCVDDAKALDQEDKADIVASARQVESKQVIYVPNNILLGNHSASCSWKRQSEVELLSAIAFQIWPSITLSVIFPQINIHPSIISTFDMHGNHQMYIYWIRVVYEELGKYGDLDDEVKCRERVEELEPHIHYFEHKIGTSNLQASKLYIGETEGPALDLFKSKLEAVMAEARSQQAASMTEFHWLGHRLPISNAKTQDMLRWHDDVVHIVVKTACLIYLPKDMEKELEDRMEGTLPTEKRLAVFNKIFAAYHEARASIRDDLMKKYVIKDYLSGLDKAICVLLGQRTIERNQLLVSIAKSKLGKSRDEKNEKVTKPEEFVRLYDLLQINDYFSNPSFDGDVILVVASIMDIFVKIILGKSWQEQRKQ
nr:signal recognition particle subunit SRP68 [Tanacetum cinerariifolium]